MTTNIQNLKALISKKYKNPRIWKKGENRFTIISDNYDAISLQELTDIDENDEESHDSEIMIDNFTDILQNNYTPDAHTALEAWQAAALISGVVMDINRTHPFKADLIYNSLLEGTIENTNSKRRINYYKKKRGELTEDNIL